MVEIRKLVIAWPFIWKVREVFIREAKILDKVEHILVLVLEKWVGYGKKTMMWQWAAHLAVGF